MLDNNVSFAGIVNLLFSQVCTAPTDETEYLVPKNITQECVPAKTYDDGRRMFKFPHIPLNLLQRSFVLNDTNVSVTSVDIASHGSFVAVGCSNGMVLLYDISSPSEQVGGYLIGHIRAKGLHTNLLLTVKITEDCRFCFAGVLKGSSEMLAIDLGKLTVFWPHSKSGKELKPKKGVALVAEDYYHQLPISVYTFADAKLRGFGAVTRLLVEDKDFMMDNRPIYRLACGRGIKNVHVWQFAPPAMGSTELASWCCIYDVASNGNTITSIGFRKGGMELLSKSAGVNIRVWDISKYQPLSAAAAAEQDVEGSMSPATIPKPSYWDLSNSQDINCLLTGKFAFGGTYEFTALKVDGPKEANRDVYELPASAGEDDCPTPGLRRRRTMREIEEVISTEDGAHVLILCADGDSFYYQQVPDLGSPVINTSAALDTNPRINVIEQLEESSESEVLSSSKQELALGQLTEIPGLVRDKANNEIWKLARVGPRGDVVLVRSMKLEKNNGYRISVNLLSNESRQVIGRSTAVEAHGVWHDYKGHYYSEKYEVAGEAAAVQKEEEIQASNDMWVEATADEPAAPAVAVVSAKKTAPPTAAKKPKAPPKAKRSESKTNLVTPDMDAIVAANSCVEEEEDHYMRLAATPNARSSTPLRQSSADKHDSEEIMKSPEERIRRPQRKAPIDYTSTEQASLSKSLFEEREHHSEASRKRKALEISPPPQVKKVVWSNATYAVRPKSPVESSVERQCKVLEAHWMLSQQTLIDNGSLTQQHVGVCAMQRMGMVLNEQYRLKQQYLQQTKVLVQQYNRRVIDLLNSAAFSDAVTVNGAEEEAPMVRLQRLRDEALRQHAAESKVFGSRIEELLLQQTEAMRTAVLKDCIPMVTTLSSMAPVTAPPKITFAYQCMFASASAYLAEVDAYLMQQCKEAFHQ